MSPFLAAIISAALVGAMAWLRLGIWQDRHASIGFGVPLILFVWLRDRKLLWATAAAFVGIALVKHLYVLPKYDPEFTAPHLVASLTSLLADTLFTAGAVHLLIGARRRLWRRNAELTQANTELAAREEEISVQNEELQTQAGELEQQSEELRQQTEELEQQGEELRGSNDELSRREQMLEALLKVSRTLLADQTQEQVLQKICEAAGPALAGDAAGAAVLLCEGDRLRVAGSWGFTAEEQNRAWATNRSVADLIIRGGGTGFIEDLAQRPDLIVPVPVEGGPFRSVLASPLRTGPRAMGTLEIYSRHPRQWTAQEFATIEWLAGQAAGVLETARLVRQLEREHRRFETVFEEMPVAVLVAEDPECRVVHGNPAAARLYGAARGANFSPLAPAGHGVDRILIKDAAELAPEQFPIVRAVLHGEEVDGEVYEATLPDGHCVTVMLSATPIRDGEGAILGGVCAMADITQQHILQQELDERRREAEAATLRKTRFLAAVSHDIRTPANAINLLAELVQRAAHDPDRREDVAPLAGDLRSNAKSLVALVTDVLDVARFDSDRIELQESEFELQDLLHEEMRKLAPLAHSRSLEFACDPCVESVWLRTDRVKLGRILNNLLGNAIKFTEQGGVRLSAERIDGHVRIRVRDTGTGIAPEHVEHIFDEFYQLRNPERDHSKGTGLGLAICKRLVSAMGGELGVKSEVGRGSTFTLTLPRNTSVEQPGGGAAAVAQAERAQSEAERAQSEAERAQSEAERAPGALGGLRVLLVEDHHATRRAAARLLEQEGAVVTQAEHGQAALDVLPRCEPEIMLLDLMLPDMDGRDVLRAMRDVRPESLREIVVLTGDVTPSRVHEVTSLGADALMAKPVDMGALLDRLSRLRV